MNTLQQRIHNSVTMIPESGCWVWNLALDHLGYGRVMIDKKNRSAHRVSFAAFKQEIPPKMELDHKCRVRCCVNPDHLEPVTHAENVRRGKRGVLNPQRQATHCKWGHEFTVENTYWKKNNSSKSRMCLACKDRRSRERRLRSKLN